MEEGILRDIPSTDYYNAAIVIRLTLTSGYKMIGEEIVRETTRPSGLLLREINDREIEWEYQSDAIGRLIAKGRLRFFNGGRWSCTRSSVRLSDLNPTNSMPLAEIVAALEKELLELEGRIEREKALENSATAERKATLDTLFGDGDLPALD